MKIWWRKIRNENCEDNEKKNYLKIGIDERVQELRNNRRDELIQFCDIVHTTESCRDPESCKCFHPWCETLVDLWGWGQRVLLREPRECNWIPLTKTEITSWWVGKNRLMVSRYEACWKWKWYERCRHQVVRLNWLRFWWTRWCKILLTVDCMSWDELSKRKERNSNWWSEWYAGCSIQLNKKI